ncbi:large conductance mechanosensitive channel [Motilibacter rhizosphaerae]|uniref:Large conductance mechanosensitive channel n=1 Tax=Motilibacter rhizosphaerae TaxID=598652 RepID=A0A4Q7NVR9_9ACTN|nr:large conductance mechanosensitive channel protein MscL [Motilibacter rhizosphaerae]RZS91080.1 large conductance mechanosensitive channel [Motilibacter rhizosphaerae]
MRKLLTEFKTFAFGGNLVDIAIGIAIGAAFAGVVQSLVDHIILPIVAAVFGQPSFHSLHGSIRGTRIPYGDFLTDLVSFLLLALVILLLVKLIKRLTGVEAAGAQGNRECDHCKSFIPVDATVCMYCTRDIEPVVA